MSLPQNPCSVCGLAILSGDSFVGTGDGTMKNGGSFAHDVCYYRREADALREELSTTKAENERLKAVTALCCNKSGQPANELAEVKAQLEVCRVALQRIVDGIPAYHEGAFIIEHFDMDGNYQGAEQVDPVGIIQHTSAIAQDAIAVLSTTQPLNSLRRLVEAMDRLMNSDVFVLDSSDPRIRISRQVKFDEASEALAEVKKEFNL